MNFFFQVSEDAVRSSIKTSIVDKDDISFADHFDPGPKVSESNSEYFLSMINSLQIKYESKNEPF